MKKLTMFCVLLCVLALSSCQTELKMAKRYMAERPSIEAAVFFPDEAVVKMETDETYGETELLKGFDQNLFLDIVYNAYAKALLDYGVEVYIPDNIDSIAVDSVHWLVMLSQMEIAGSITEYEDVLFSDTDEFSYKHPLNTVNVASWFEINDGEWRPIQYCEHNLIDGFSSKVDYSFWENKVDYKASVDTLELNDVYNYGVYLGKLYAGYTYDYMMNSYVGKELSKKGYIYQLLLRYDPYKKQLRYAEEGDGFVGID